MAELYSIRCYYNTGFNVNNRPADISVLNNAEYRDFPSNYLWQNKDLATTRVKAEWHEISDADYVRIGDAYYLITGVSMISGQTAEIGLQIDPLLSMGGVSSIDRVSGWTERAHVPASQDTLFGNVLSEPWAPSQPLVMDAVEQIGSTTTGDRVNIVQSTVKLDEIEHTAQVYATEAGEIQQGAVTVPLIPPATKRCTFSCYAFGTMQFTYPHSSFYFADNPDVSAGINDVRSLGIESAILTAYQIPKVFAPTMSNPEFSGAITTLVNMGADKTPSDAMLYRYGSRSVHNAKVYAMYNIYHLLSSCSGDRGEWKAEDLYSGGDKPTFVEYADLSPNGKPFMQPKYYHGAQTKMYQETVKGEAWLRVPLSYTEGSGNLINSTAYMRGLQRQEAELVVSGVENVYNTAKAALSGNLLGAVENAARGVVDAQRTFMDIQEDAVNFQTQQRIIAPEVKFAQEYGAQGYVGNTFWLYRTRLSDSDMERADNFFTQFGYAQDKKFDISDLTNRSYFNFIKTRDADVTGEAPLRIRQQCAALFNSGVRLWHVLPTAAAMTYNP